MNKKIAMSAISIVSSLAIMGGATFAFFSSTATSTNNTFAAGEITLLLDDDNEATAAAAVSQSLDFSGFLPGVSSTKSISIHNGDLTTPIAEVELKGTKNSDDTDGFLLEDVIEFTSIRTGSDSACSGSTEHLPAITAGIGNGVAPLTLAELLATSGYDALPGLAGDATYWVCFTSKMQDTAGNGYQGDSLNFDVNFTANQDVSQ